MSASSLVNVVQWGINVYQPNGLDTAFKFCDNAAMTATDAPNLSACLSLFETFYRFGKNAKVMNQVGLIKWDVSAITDFYSTFEDAYISNVTTEQGFTNWDVSNANRMYSMFRNTSVFDQDISGWAVANVTNCANFKANSALTAPNTPNFTSCTP